MADQSENESSELLGYWHKAFGVDLGDEVMILPVGSQNGQGFQGILVDVAINGQTMAPIAVIIQQAPGMPHVTIPWHAIQMITKPQVSAADNAQAQKMAQDLASLEPQDVIAFFEENGIEISPELREAAIEAAGQQA